MKNLLLAIILIAPIVDSCQIKEERATPKNQKVEKYAEDIINTHSIPGMAIAVLKDNSVIHKGFYGNESLKTKKTISSKTLFKVFSLTKTFVATGIFQLIEQGKVSLTDKLSDHFEGLPRLWTEVTIANLLSHSSGLPDIRHLIKELQDDSISDKELVNMLFDDEMDFAPNTQWNYNQTNFILLKMLIEKQTSSTFENYILENQFPESKEEDVLFSSGANTNILNQATYYNYNRETESFELKNEFSGHKNHPLAGINLTLDEYIHWNQRLDKDEFFSKESKSNMWTPFEFTESDRQFLHGWDVYAVNDNNSFGFSGGGVSGFRKFVEKNLTIIILTTGYKNYSVQDIIIDHIAGIVDPSLYDQNASLTEDIMGTYFLNNSTKNYSYIIEKVKQENPKINLEETFNSIGFTLFFQLDRQDDAIDLFKLNALENPESFDAFGSLGYLYFLTEQYQLARDNYVKALDLNPENTYSERRIKEIDNILHERAN